MKLSAARFAQLIQAPQSAPRPLLIFGPDRGLVRERAEAWGRTIVDDLRDPFRCTELASAAVRAEPGLLRDEACSLGLVAGPRLVRVRDATDAIIEAVRLLLAAHTLEAAVLLEAGDLAKRSPLRNAFEDCPRAFALPCYEDDPSALREVISQMLSAADVTIDDAGIDHLLACLGQDRATTRSELAKLISFVGPGAQVRSDDVRAIIEDSSTASLNELAQATCAGNIATVAGALASSGIEPIAALRSVALVLQRLHLVHALIAEGRSVRDAVACLRPPVFYRGLDSFYRLVRQWPSEDLAQALALLTSSEIACKQTGAPQRAIAGAALLKIASMRPSRRA